MANNNSLYFLACISVLLAEARPGRGVLLDLAGEGCLGVPDVELIGVGSCMHHKLLRFEIVGFRNKIRNYVCVFRQQRLVIDLLPLEPLSKLLRRLA